jgi:CubicO group peptidase (beta-lactamase class C family)
MDTAEDRKQAVVRSLTPSVRVADRPTHWTVAERMAHHACPGVGVAALRDGRIDWVDGFGVREAGGTDPVGPDTAFLVASCSKPVTAALVLRHVELGEVDLDVDVNRYLRRWQVPENEFTADHPVTLRGILSHTAGLTVNGFGVLPRDGRPRPTELDLLLGRPPSDQPAVVVDKAHDGAARYSGGGYVAAQVLLEDVTGRPFEDLAEELVFAPLGMARSGYACPPPTHLLDDLASGHGDDGRPHAGGWMWSAEKAAGGLVTTARDYATFLLALRSAYLGEPGAFLAHDTAREMMTRPGTGAFGLGPKVLGEGAALRISHGGSNDGYQSETDCFLESGDGGIVFTNSTSGLFLFREVLNGMAEVYDWPGYLLEPKRVVELDERAKQQLVGSYRITLGIELPELQVWVEDGRLMGEVPGLRFGPQEIFCDDHGVFFQQTGPFEVTADRDPDGAVRALLVLEGGVPIIRAERVEGE